MAKIYLEERGRSIQVSGKAKKTEAAFSGFWILWYFPVSARLERCLSFVAPHMLLLFQPLYSAVPLQSYSATSHFPVSDFFSVTAYLFFWTPPCSAGSLRDFLYKSFHLEERSDRIFQYQQNSTSFIHCSQNSTSFIHCSQNSTSFIQCSQNSTVFIHCWLLTK